MGESRNVVVHKWLFGIAVSLGPALGVVAAFGDHAEVGIEGDADGGVEGDLEGGAHALRTHRGHKLLGLCHLYHLPEECLPIIEIGLGGAFLLHPRPLLGDGVLIAEDSFHT